MQPGTKPSFIVAKWSLKNKLKKKSKIHCQKGKGPILCPLRQLIPLHAHQSQESCKITSHNTAFNYFIN